MSFISTYLPPSLPFFPPPSLRLIQHRYSLPPTTPPSLSSLPFTLSIPYIVRTFLFLIPLPPSSVYFYLSISLFLSFSFSLSLSLSPSISHFSHSLSLSLFLSLSPSLPPLHPESTLATIPTASNRSRSKSFFSVGRPMSKPPAAV